MAKTRFDFEQQIMSCWAVTDDIDTVYEYVMDDPDFAGMDPVHADKIANLLLGMSAMYSVKFDKMFKTFQELTRAHVFDSTPERMMLPSVNRVEVIGPEQRDYVNMKATEVEASFQDNGETLKIFLK